jgi:hypothetical protein
MSGISGAGKTMIKGEFHLIKHDTTKIKGTGPGGSVTFHDLWETVGDGSPKNPFRHRAKAPEIVEAVTQDVKAPNKCLQRVLNWFMYSMTKSGYGGVNYNYGITYNATTQPINAFALLTKKTASFLDGDERVEFTESNGQYDVLVPPYADVIAEGRRSILISTTSGPGLRRVESRYPQTDPHREVEYTFFAEAHTSPGYASGDVTVDAANKPADATYIIVRDGINTDLNVEFDTAGGMYYNPATDRYLIDISGAITNDQLRDRMIIVLNLAFLNKGFYLVASSGGSGKVRLTHTAGGAIGNKAVGNSGWMPLGSWALPTLSAGSARETTDAYVDNFPMRAIALAEGVACGNGEAANRVAVRAIIGPAPTFTGICDRTYQHEFQIPDQTGVGDTEVMHKYAAGETITAIGLAGYVARSTGAEPTGEQASVQVDSSITTDAANDINAATQRIFLPMAVTALSATGGFKSSAHVRKTIEILASGAGNNGLYTIKRVISPVEIEVYEAPVAPETGTFNAVVWTTYYGKNAFDGRVINQGRIEVVAADPDIPGDIVLGEKWVSDNNAGPHVIGRVWTAAKTISGIRIIGPAGTNKNFYPEAFTIQYLNPAANGGDPRPGTDSDWTNVGGTAVYSSQSSNIYDNGAYGYEYTFTSVSTKGIRLSSLTALSNTQRVEIGEMFIFGPGPTITLVAGVDDTIKFSVDNTVSWRTVSVGAFGPSSSFTSLVDKLNAYLRGYQVEFTRNTFGYLWFRGTVAGSKSKLDIAAVADSTINTVLGLPALATQKIGITQEVRKLPTEALTIIYRINISGDLSQPS